MIISYDLIIKLFKLLSTKTFKSPTFIEDFYFRSYSARLYDRVAYIEGKYEIRVNNLREKFSPGPGIEPGSPALRAGAITTKPPRRSAGPS